MGVCVGLCVCDCVFVCMSSGLCVCQCVCLCWFGWVTKYVYTSESFSVSVVHNSAWYNIRAQQPVSVQNEFPEDHEWHCNKKKEYTLFDHVKARMNFTQSPSNKQFFCVNPKHSKNAMIRL